MKKTYPAKKNGVEPTNTPVTPKRRGRPPGTGGKSTLVDITFEQLMELKDFIGVKGMVTVNRKWLEKYCDIKESAKLTLELPEKVEEAPIYSEEIL